MRFRTASAGFLFGILIIGSPLVGQAAPITRIATGTVVDVSGSYTGEFTLGQIIVGSYTYDTDEANASSAQTTPNTNPGHEFSSFYEFASPPYGVTLTTPSVGTFFTNNSPVAVLVTDDLSFGVGDIPAGLIPAGTYDLVEILGATTASGGCSKPGGNCTPNELDPVSGEEWTLALLGEPAWVIDGSVIPDGLPGTLTTLIHGIDIDATGQEIGEVWIELSSLTVPEPSLALLLFAGLSAAFTRRSQR